MNSVRVVTAAYNLALDRHPMLTEMCSSGFLWCVGDLATQQVEKFTNNNNDKSDNSSTRAKNNDIDWQRTMRQTAYASLCWGPVAHKWYRSLDRVAQSLVKSKKPGPILATKFALEMIFLHPVSLWAYFTIIGRLNGESSSEIRRQLQTDYWPTFVFEVFLWTPVDVLNFSFVPVRHQLLVVNCACFAESIALSFVKNNGIEKVKQTLPFFPDASSDEEVEEKTT